jgi:hypothetical protein
MVTTSKFSDITNTTSVDARDDLLHKELDVYTTCNKDDTL